MSGSGKAAANSNWQLVISTGQKLTAEDAEEKLEIGRAKTKQQQNLFATDSRRSRRSEKAKPLTTKDTKGITGIARIAITAKSAKSAKIENPAHNLHSSAY